MKATLHYREGSSDKIYIVEQVEKGENLFLVNFAYGRRGSTLNTGTKTKTAVSKPEADKIFQKLINEKRAKGYNDISDGSTANAPVYVAAETEIRRTDYPVQLLNPVEGDSDLRQLQNAGSLLMNNEYAAQEKHDGKRMTLIYENGQVKAGNRKNLECGYPQAFGEALINLVNTQESETITKLVIDGEAVGDTFIAFDLLVVNDTDLRQKPFYMRLEVLKNLLRKTGTLNPVSPTLVFCNAEFDTLGKTNLFKEIQERGGEGIVFKHISAPYTPGQPASGGTQLKYKFCQDATCVVASHHSSKSSIGLAVRHANGGLVNVGNCKIPTNYAFPAIGELVEIRYLYAFREGSLYQPVYKGLRDDKTQADLHDSLKFKNESLSTVEDAEENSLTAKLAA